MTKDYVYQENTVNYVKEKIHTLNMIILISIILVLFLVFKYSYNLLDYIPQSSVSVMLAVLAVFTCTIYALSKVTSIRALQAIESYSSKLNTLLSTSRDVHRINYSDILIENIIKSAIKITDADGAVLMAVNGKTIFIKITGGIVDEKLKGLRFIKAVGVVEKAIYNGETVNISDVENTDTYLSDIDRKIIRGAKSLLCMPLSLDGKNIGALELVRKEGPFSAEEEELMRYFVEQSTLAMKKNSFNEDVKNYEIQLTNILVEAIEGQIKKKGHLRRTAKFALLIGRDIGMSDTDLKTLYRASMLHDIGFLKINLDEITSVEQYNGHALLGFNILDQINFCRDISCPVLHHHERYDGNGYPQRLSGEAIPIISRIISIAEVFDVMMNRTTHQCKARNPEDNIIRHDLSVSEAICELKKNAGKQFDPYLLDVFIRKISEEYHGTGITILDSPVIGEQKPGKEINNNIIYNNGCPKNGDSFYHGGI